MTLNQSNGPGNKSRIRWQSAAVVGACAVVTGLAFLARTCAPQTEGPMPAPSASVSASSKTPQKACPGAPKKDDSKCEIDKGEHDPSSPTWDYKSCGYCGDGTAQQWEVASWQKYETTLEVEGVKVNPIICDYDYACDIDAPKKAERYAVLDPKNVRGTVVYSFVVSEPPKCEAKPKPAATSATTATPAKTSEKPPPAVTTPEPPVSTKVGPCPGTVTNSQVGRAIAKDVRGAVGAKAGEIRNQLGAAPSDKVGGSASFNVSATGAVSFSSISVSCRGECSTKSLGKGAVLGIVGSIPGGGRTLPSPGSACVLSVSFGLSGGK